MIERLIFCAVISCIVGCSDHSYDHNLDDNCKIESLAKKRSVLRRLDSAAGDCSKFSDDTFLVALDCSGPDYVDAVSAYSVRAILRCGSCEQINTLRQLYGEGNRRSIDLEGSAELYGGQELLTRLDECVE